MLNRRAQIIGAGISGLSAAYFLKKAGWEVEVSERHAHAGGLIQTKVSEFGLVETAANGFLNSPLVEKLSAEIGVEMQATLKKARRRYIFRDGKPRQWPFRLRECPRLLFFIFKLSFFRKRLVPSPGQTLRQWGSEHLGPPICTQILETAFQGIYAGDPAQLSASLLLEALFKKPNAKNRASTLRLGRGTVAPVNGMGEWLQKLYQAASQAGVIFHFNSEAPQSPPDDNQVRIIATAAPEAAQLLESYGDSRFEILKQIQMRSLLSTTVFMPQSSVRYDGFGILFPENCGHKALGVLRPDSIFANRARSGFRSETWIFSHPEWSDQQIAAAIRAEQSRIENSSDAPVTETVTSRWLQALPHYTVELEGLLKQLSSLNENHKNNIYLLGNYLGEIGLRQILERLPEFGATLNGEFIMKGIIVLNLGTPDSPEPADVKRYLKQFLMDKWVVDIPWIWRWILVNILIVPRRQYASSEAYHKIWSQAGSPLRIHLLAVVEKLKKYFPDTLIVPAMRYGKPSIASALLQLKAAGVRQIKVFQLYPQYAESSVRSSEEEVLKQMRELDFTAQVSFVSSYYQDPGFIAAYAEVISAVLQKEKPDHLLLSFHGVPERHVKRTDLTGAHCLRSKDCCAEMVAANAFCYRAQCYATARALASALGLKNTDYSVSFQSRLGRTPWIQPYTDFRYSELVQAGHKKIAVACPSFAADCLETIEEIGLRGRVAFQEAGGEELFAIGCLNSNDKWVEAVAQLIEKN